MDDSVACKNSGDLASCDSAWPVAAPWLIQVRFHGPDQSWVGVIPIAPGCPLYHRWTLSGVLWSLIGVHGAVNGCFLVLIGALK